MRGDEKLPKFRKVSVTVRACEIYLARQQRDACLQTPDARRRFSIGHEPFWHKVRRGLYLGYRKGLNGGVWWVREYRAGRYAKPTRHCRR